MLRYQDPLWSQNVTFSNPLLGMPGIPSLNFYTRQLKVSDSFLDSWSGSHGEIFCPTLYSSAGIDDNSPFLLCSNVGFSRLLWYQYLYNPCWQRIYGITLFSLGEKLEFRLFCNPKNPRHLKVSHFPPRSLCFVQDRLPVQIDVLLLVFSPEWKFA